MLGHVRRMPGNRCLRKQFYGKPGGERSHGRPRKTWEDGVEKDLIRFCVHGWWRRPHDKDQRNGVVEQARAQHHLQHQLVSYL